MAANAYFVIGTAGNCRHCNTFKQNTKAPLIAALQSIPGLDIINIQVATTAGPNSQEMVGKHPDLKSKMKWFPTFLLFNQSWIDETKRLEGVIFNGYINPSTGDADLNKPGSRLPLDHISLTNWVQRELATNPIFKTNLAPSLSMPNQSPGLAGPGVGNYSGGMIPLTPLPAPSSRPTGVMVYDSHPSNSSGSMVYGNNPIKFGIPVSEDVFGRTKKRW